MKKEYRFAIIALIALFLFWHPLTRKIIFVILPLGRGLDDLIAVILLVGLILWGSRRWWIEWNKTKAFRKIDRDRNIRVKQATLVVIIFMALVLTQCSSMQDVILFGKPASSELITVSLISSAVIVIGWNVISFFDRRRS
jgi:hypothetical protein